MRGTRVVGATLVVEVVLSVNMKSLTLEEVTSRRKKMLTDTLQGLKVDLRQRTQQEGMATGEAIDYFVSLLEANADASALAHEAEWYNDDAQLQSALGAHILPRSPLCPVHTDRSALCALQVWM